MNLKDLTQLDKDDLLDALGLQTRAGAVDYVVPGLLVFGAGLAVGCGIGMLLAPKAGAELRGQLGEAINKGLESGKQQLAQMKERAAQAPAAASPTMNRA